MFIPIRQLHLHDIIVDLVLMMWAACLYDMRQSSDLAIARAVYMLHRVLKELSTKRLARDRAALAAVSVQLFPVLAEVWVARSSQLLAALGPWAATHSSSAAVDDEALVPLAELVTHLIKCLYRITLCGFPNTMQVQRRDYMIYSLPLLNQLTL